MATPIVYPIHARSAFSRVAERMGHRSDAVLLRRSVRRSAAEEARHLKLNEGDDVIELVTLRLIDDQPASLMTQVFSLRHEPLLRSYTGGSVRTHLERQDITLTRVFSVVAAALPSEDDAAQLRMSCDAPVLVLKTLSSESSGRPFEFTNAVFHADWFQFLVVADGEFTDDF